MRTESEKIALAKKYLESRGWRCLPPQAKPSKLSNSDMVLNFNDLHPDQRVPSSVVCSLFNCGKTTLWLRIKEGRIPKPVQFGKWRAGDIREALSNSSQHSA